MDVVVIMTTAVSAVPPTGMPGESLPLSLPLSHTAVYDAAPNSHFM